MQTLKAVQQSRPQTMCFSVTAHAEAGSLPRVCQPFAKRGLTLSSVHAVVDAGNDEMQIDLQIQNVNDKLAHQIAASLRQYPDVTCVLFSQKG